MRVWKLKQPKPEKVFCHGPGGKAHAQYGRITDLLLFRICEPGVHNNLTASCAATNIAPPLEAEDYGFLWRLCTLHTQWIWL